MNCPSRWCQGASAPATIPLRGANGKPLGEWPVTFAVPWTAAAYAADGMVWEPMPSDGPDLVRHAVGDCTPLATATLSGPRAPIRPAERKMIESNLAAEAKRWSVETPAIEELPAHQS